MKAQLRQIWIAAGMFCVLVYAGKPARAQQPEPYGGAHIVVQHTLNDLQRVQITSSQDNKDRTRTDDAVKHLSDFDSRLAKHHFDKGILDSAIQNVADVSEKNHLGDHDRDALVADTHGLRQLRQKYDSWH